MIIDEATALALDPPRAARPAARRRLGMVALCYAYRALAALLVATPVAAAATDVVGSYPRGDAMLFDAGGLMLSEASRLARPALAPLSAQGGVLALLFWTAGLFPLAALIVSLGREGRLSLAFVAGRAASAWSTLVLLGGTALLAQGAVALLIVLLGQKGIELAHLGVRGADIALVGVVGVSGLAALAVGVVHDLARVGVANDGQRFYAATARALAVARRAWWRAGWAYAWRGGVSLGVLGAAAWLGHTLLMGSGVRLVLAALVFQGAIALAIFLRASWLAAAIGIVEREAPLAWREAGAGAGMGADAGTGPDVGAGAGADTDAGTEAEAEAATGAAPEAPPPAEAPAEGGPAGAPGRPGDEVA